MLMQDNQTMHRFEAIEDDQIAGLIDYKVRDGRHWLVHTEVYEVFQGSGVGDVLVEWALDDLRSRSAVVVPTCPFVADWLRRHPDYQDLVDHETLRDYKRRQRDRATASEPSE